MNEWDLQAALTKRWLTKPPEITSFGRLDLLAWELMFPSWDINHKTTRWNEPSLDFVFLSENGSFVLVELKNSIPNRSAFLSAFCQVSHRAVQFIHTFSSERLANAYKCCMAGACQRSLANPASLKRVSERLHRLSTSASADSVYRVIAAVDFPKSHHSLLDQFNGCSYLEMSNLIGLPPKSSKERLRFCEMADKDYDRLRINQVSLYPLKMEEAQSGPRD